MCPNARRDGSQARVESNAVNGRETLCVLMLDEMAVRRHVEHVNGKYYGYVDVGSGDVNDSTPVARDALVLMVVSVNGSWKLPIGYFLVDGMSGKERANLVTESLHRLHAVGVRTVSLTCDGPSCHFAMMRSLGAKLTMNDMNPSFTHPADHLLRVYVILDVCHMIKLLRNSFADGLILKTSGGETIKWQYVEELNKLQEAEGLRRGNKLKSAHIQWKKQKMKVNLAAQMFSSSVADALQYCNEGLKLPQFAGCEATVTFIRTIDGAFDVLNSRHPLGKGAKAPMKQANQEQSLNTLQDAEQYISGLKDAAGTCMHLGPRKTGYIGFIASIRSVTRLSLELVVAPDAPMEYLLTYKLSQDHLELHLEPRKTGYIGFIASIRSVTRLSLELVAAPDAPMEYLLTYKLSQDHLMLFFSAVRARGVFNNNPTARQFQDAYKRLLMRHHVRNGTGNCLVRDETTVLHVDRPSPQSISLASMTCSPERLWPLSMTMQTSPTLRQSHPTRMLSSATFQAT